MELRAAFVEEIQALAEGTSTFAEVKNARQLMFVESLLRVAFTPRIVSDASLAKLVFWGPWLGR